MNCDRNVTLKTAPSSTPSPFDGLIVGSGPIAYLAAIALKDAGYNVAMLQQPGSPSARSAQAKTVSPLDPPSVSMPMPDRPIALNQGSLIFLDTLGVQTALAPHLVPFRAIDVRQGSTCLHLSPTLLGHEQVGAIIPFHALLQTLKNIALQQDMPVICDGLAHLENTASGCAVHLASGAQLDSSWLIVAEGKNSPLLATLGWDHAVISEKEDAAFIANLRLSHPHQCVGQQCFHGREIIALLPLADPHEVSLVWSGPEALIQAHLRQPPYPADHPDHWCNTIARGFEIENVTQLSSTAVFPLTRFLAKRWFQHRLILMGDSAHAVHPLAGQGLNQGIHDLQIFLNIMGPPHPWATDLFSKFQRYQREARNHALEWLTLTEGLQTLFASSLMPSALVQQGLSCFGKINPLKRRVMAHAMGLS